MKQLKYQNMRPFEIVIIINWKIMGLPTVNYSFNYIIVLYLNYCI